MNLINQTFKIDFKQQKLVPITTQRIFDDDRSKILILLSYYKVLVINF
jgi:hypothetical protein